MFIEIKILFHQNRSVFGFFMFTCTTFEVNEKLLFFLSMSEERQNRYRDFNAKCAFMFVVVPKKK